MTAVPLIFNPSATAAFAALVGGSPPTVPGTGGDNTVTADGISDVQVVAVWDLDLSTFPACTLADIAEVHLSAQYIPTGTVTVVERAAFLLFGDASTFTAWGTVTPETDEEVGLVLPNTLSLNAGALAPAPRSFGGTWAGSPGPTVAQVALYIDIDTNEPVGDTLTVTKPTADVVFTAGSPCAAPVVPIANCVDPGDIYR